MKARFPGKCAISGKAIEVGVDITYHNGNWVLLDEVKALAAGPALVKAKEVAHATINPSVQQEAVFSFIKSGNGNGAVVAVAGSGKTTTLIMAMQHVPKNAKCAFVAFNRHIADELRSRCPKHVKVYTVHSLGLYNVRRLWGDEDNPISVNADKLDLIMDNIQELKLPIGHMNRNRRAKIGMLRSSIRRLVSMCKMTLSDSDPVSLRRISAQYGIDFPADDNLVYKLVPEILRLSKETTEIVDFDDMIWLPATSNVPLKKFDFLFVDEAQDLNPLQLEFVMRSVCGDIGRVLAVGDPKQSIFGWAGADVKAMPRLIDNLSAYEMPLSTSYRCPRSHVAIAKEICPQIEARPDAEEGTVENYTLDDFAPQAGDMIICRNNAPLIPYAFDCIRKGLKAVVRGRDIGQHLAGLADRIINKANSIEEAKDKLMLWHHNESMKLITHEAPQTQIDSLNDRVLTIRAVMEECKEPLEVPQRIEDIFSDKKNGVMFSSVHRAKGLEADRVWILRPDLLERNNPNWQDWELEQEINVRYVALTRSKRDLFFVHEK